MANQYFELARNEEMGGNDCAALLFYISSFCCSFNSRSEYPIGATEKIRRLQLSIGLSDEQLVDMVRSYGYLSDRECKQLLYFSIYGCLSGIDSVLRGSAYGY